MNASLPMLVTPSGITILVRAEQLWNACVPRVRTVFGITILVSLEQP